MWNRVSIISAQCCGGSCGRVDIAEDLIEVAKKKSSSFDPKQGIILFPVYFDFVDKYNRAIYSLLKEKITKEKYTPPTFQVADGRRLPFPNEIFDHVNCAGSTLSFIDEHRLALSEIARVLRPGGTFFLEVESRWNVDLLFTVIDAILRNRLGYDTTLREAFRAIFTQPTEYICINYPFGNPENPVNMKIKLFTMKGLNRELSDFGLKMLKKWTIHSLTNFIPSTYLDMANPPKWLRNLFSFFANTEERIPISLPGCSIVLLAQKEVE